MRPLAPWPNAATPCSRPPSPRYAGSACVRGGSVRSPPPRWCSYTTSTTAQHDQPSAQGRYWERLTEPGGVEQPAQHHDRLPGAAQCASTVSRPASGAFSGQQLGDERDGGLPDREYSGVGDKIRHAGPRRESIFGRTVSSTEVPPPTLAI